MRVGQVSVVIPVLNGADTIAAQLDALEAQGGGTSFEVVVADNGSTDGTVAIVDEYVRRAALWSLVDASAQPGSSHARNEGTRIASGEAILYCDADDIVERDWVLRLAEPLGRVDGVGGPLVSFDAEGPLAGAPRERFWLRFGFLPAPAGANLGVTRRAFDAIGGWDEDMLRAQDIDFFWRLQLQGFEVQFVDEAVVHYRRRPTPRKRFIQEFRYGLDEVTLFCKFRTDGMRAPTVTRVLYRWLHLVVTSYRLLGDRRTTWLAHAGKNLGRLVGSINNKTWFP